jgi:hypothetical protein
MRQLYPIKAQGAAECLDRFGRGRDGAALLQLDIPLGADPGALRHFLTLEAGRATPLPGRIGGFVRVQARATGT